jgi:hypothetical protein
VRRTARPLEKPAEVLDQRIIAAVLLGDLGARLERWTQRQIRIGRILGEHHQDQPSERYDAV